MCAEKISGGLRIFDWKIPYFSNSIGPKVRDWIKGKVCGEQTGMAFIEELRIENICVSFGGQKIINFS